MDSRLRGNDGEHFERITGTHDCVVPRSHAPAWEYIPGSTLIAPKQFSEDCLKPRRFLGLKFNRRSINKPNGTLYIDAPEKMDPGMKDSVDSRKEPPWITVMPDGFPPSRE